MADRVKDVATGEAERLKALTTEAVKSQAYLYPIKVSSEICVSRVQQTKTMLLRAFCTSSLTRRYGNLLSRNSRLQSR